MRSTALLAWSRRHLHWLLCLALLVPAAQLAGALHALSHVTGSTPATERHPGAPATLDHCAICQLAAALGAGGAPAATATFDLPVDDAQPPAAPVVAPPALPPTRRFLARAPPPLPH